MTPQEKPPSGSARALPSLPAAELAALDEAVHLAARALGATSPNPVVGCVILDAHGQVVGRGWHERAGAPHAEVNALREAGPQAAGGTAVVTLEPCRHTGRTGPCTSALLEAGIARVVIGASDPTSQAGGGGRVLADAGLEVIWAEHHASAQVNAAWLHWARTGRPRVTWKFAATLDGRSSAADGSSQWITSEAARADVHQLRTQVDAIMVGAGTARLDNPALTARPRGHLAPRQPLRIVLDSQARLSPELAIFDNSAPTLHVREASTPSPTLPHGVDLLALPGMDLAALLQQLGERGIRSLLLEGGPTLAGAMLQAALIDEARAYLAPSFLGAGAPALHAPAITSIAQISRWQFTEITPIGPDLRLTAIPIPDVKGP